MELRFEGSEELGYDPLASPPRGEICLRGPIVFDGYYEDKKKTEEAFGERPVITPPCCGCTYSSSLIRLCCVVLWCPPPNHLGSGNISAPSNHTF